MTDLLIKRLMLVAVMLISGMFGPTQAQQDPDRAVIYLTRHASTEEDGSADPPLCPIGWGRARALAEMLEPVGIKAILTTGYKRTRQTAAPLSRAIDVPIELVDVRNGLPQHIEDVLTFVEEHPSEPMLIVGHSNTIPAIIQALGGPQMRNLYEDEFGDLFVLRADGHVESMRYGD